MHRVILFVPADYVGSKMNTLKNLPRTAITSGRLSYSLRVRENQDTVRKPTHFVFSIT